MTKEEESSEEVQKKDSLDLLGPVKGFTQLMLLQAGPYDHSTSLPIGSLKLGPKMLFLCAMQQILLEALFFVDYLEYGDSKLLQNLRNNLPMNKASNTNLKSHAILKFLK